MNKNFCRSFLWGGKHGNSIFVCVLQIRMLHSRLYGGCRYQTVANFGNKNIRAGNSFVFMEGGFTRLKG